LLHDDTLERTANINKNINKNINTENNIYADSWTWQNLMRLDAGAWHSAQYVDERLPTLDTIAEFIHEYHASINIEIKTTSKQHKQHKPQPLNNHDAADAKLGALVANKAAQLWGDKPYLPQPLLSSFSQAALAAAYAAQPQLPRALLVESLPDNWQSVLPHLGCCAIVCEVSHLTQPQAQAIKQAGYRLAVYTCNDVPQALQCLAWGVDSIITDNMAMQHDNAA
jgi:glycerophosphoryl diester phosphodiesterase